MEFLLIKVHSQTQIRYMAVTIQIRYEIPEPFIRLTGASIKYGSEPAVMPQKGSGSSSVVSCLCKFRSA